MTRPARKIFSQVLGSLISRPKLRYTLTKKGEKALESGETGYTDLLDSLVEAIQANNKQPISMQTWRKFYLPKKIANGPVRDLVETRMISLVSRGKYSFAVE